MRTEGQQRAHLGARSVSRWLQAPALLAAMGGPGAQRDPRLPFQPGQGPMLTVLPSCPRPSVAWKRASSLEQGRVGAPFPQVQHRGVYHVPVNFSELAVCTGS